MKPVLKSFSVLTLFALTFSSQAEDESTTNSVKTVKAEKATQSTISIDNRTETERINLLIGVAQVYHEEEDFDAAVSALERVLEINPAHKQTRYLLSHYYISAKQYEKAESSLIQLIKEFPEDYQVKNNLAWLYATAEDPAYRKGKAAVKLAQQAMVEAPYDHHVWSTLSEAYYICGEYEKAHRAIDHMRVLAVRFGGNTLTQETVDEYLEQLDKCKRAWDIQKELDAAEADTAEEADEQTSAENDSE